MEEPYFSNRIFTGHDTINKGLMAGEYENCLFRQCDISEADLSGRKFESCRFEDCNLSMAKIQKTAFRKVVFKDCKILGLHFENCLEFGLQMTFEHCQMHHSTFLAGKFKKTTFLKCDLTEVDFSGSDFSGTLFEDCNLNRAVFENTNLENADLCTAFNFIIDPEINHLKGAIFSTEGLPGLLKKYGIKIEN